MVNNADTDLRRIFSVIRRWKWLILGCALLGGVVVYRDTAWLPPVFRATTTLLVEPSQETGLSDYSALMAGERLAFTYSQMIEGPLIRERVITQLNLTETPDDLSKKIIAEPVANTQLLRLTVTDSSPEKAALLADTIAEIFTAHVQTLQTDRYANLMQSVQEQMDASTAKVSETEAEIDTASSTKIEAEARLIRLQALLAELRSDYQSLQQDYQDVQLTMDQAANSVKIVEGAQVPETSVRFPYVATVIQP